MNPKIIPRQSTRPGLAMLWSLTSDAADPSASGTTLTVGQSNLTVVYTSSKAMGNFKRKYRNIFSFLRESEKTGMCKSAERFGRAVYMD